MIAIITVGTPLGVAAITAAITAAIRASREAGRAEEYKRNTELMMAAKNEELEEAKETIKELRRGRFVP